jgi:prepilin-type N-terminal cleavage/methylation domain-containing protein
MAATMIVRQPGSGTRKQAESGFSLLEVLISMAVLTIGLVSLLSVFGLAMASTQTSQQDMIAKQLANESLESIVTARNSSQLAWDQVQNVGQGDGNGIFAVGLQQMNLPGVDGIYGTTDDSGVRQTLRDPGPDGIFGNSDDIYIPLTGYQRQIQFSDVQDANGNTIPSVRAITISVQYAATQSGQIKNYVLSSYISQYR